MSSYVCDKGIFSYFGSVFFKMGQGSLTRSDAVNIGRVLYRENCRSVLHQYPQDSDEINPDFPIIDEGDILFVEMYSDELKMAIECLEYQSCEHPDWEKSIARKILGSLSEKAGQYPQSGKAEWGVPRSFVTKDMYVSL